MDFRNNINLNGNYIIKGGIERLNAAPANPKVNQMYVDSAENLIKQYDGSNWIVLGVSGAMIYKGTVGTGGTVTTLPTDVALVTTGDTYMVCADGTYAGTQKAVVGDLFIAKKDSSTTPATVTWTYVPSGNDKFVYQATGDNVTTTYSITHTLNSQDVSVEIYDISTGNTIITDVKRVDANNIQVIFADAVPTGTNYKVVISY